MSENITLPVLADAKARALIDEKKYREMYAASLADPIKFWEQQGKRIDWIKPYSKVKDTHYSKEHVSIKWYADGTLNACVNCIDRHLPSRAQQTALIWEGDEPNQQKTITYQTLYEEVCRFANVLKAQGVKKGDRVTIYMPMILEAAYAMLACARIGAIHSVVFGGFSPDALAGRIKDCESRFLITADAGVRGAKKIPLKANVDEALAQTQLVEKVIIIKHIGEDTRTQKGRDVWYHEEKAKVNADCPAVEMQAEDPLFILYTSGSTGKPKGVLHTTGGYMVYASLTHEYI